MLLVPIYEVEVQYNIALEKTRDAASRGVQVAKEAKFMLRTLSSTAIVEESYIHDTRERIQEMKQNCDEMAKTCNKCALDFNSIKMKLLEVSAVQAITRTHGLKECLMHRYNMK